MSHDEILERIKYLAQKMGWSTKDIAVKTGIEEDSIVDMINGENVSLFDFLDLLEGMGMEIRIM